MNVSVVEGVKGQPALLDRGDLGAAATAPTTDSYWVRLGTDTDEQALAATDRITELARQEAPGSDVQGMTEMRSALDSILDTMLMVVAGIAVDSGVDCFDRRRKHHGTVPFSNGAANPDCFAHSV